MRIFISVFLVLLFSCSEPEKQVEESTPKPSVYELQAVDAEFSEYSKKYGFRKAFMEYIDEDGIILRDNNYPFKGARAIEYLVGLNDSSVSMTWESQGGDIASSGDLGYTFGIYEMRDKNEQVEKGTYLLIWKKKKDGTWKFVLDSNNQGITE
ncbi:MAG: YybH family protein [Sphingobacteriales bacterium]|jgi:ketosteroid isomerase-like protein